MWDICARKVYAEVYKFGSVKELQEAIQKAWCGISKEYLKSLIDSMLKRIDDVIYAHGGPTKY